MFNEASNNKEDHINWQAPKEEKPSIFKKMRRVLKRDIWTGKHARTLVAGLALTAGLPAQSTGERVIGQVFNGIERVGTEVDRARRTNNERRRGDQTHQENTQAEENRRKADKQRHQEEINRQKQIDQENARRNKADILNTMGAYGLEEVEAEESTDGKIKAKAKTGVSSRAKDEVTTEEAKSKRRLRRDIEFLEKNKNN